MEAFESEMNEQGFHEFIKVAGPGPDQEAPKVGQCMEMLVPYGLIGADGISPSIVQDSGIALIVVFASLRRSFHMDNDAVMNHKVSIASFCHSQA